MPLTDDYSVCDLAVDLGLPVVVVARAGLGTINHTLLTLAVARAAGLDVRAVVLNPWPAAPGPMLGSNRETIARLGRIDVHTLPRIEAPRRELLARAGATLPIAAWLQLGALKRIGTRRPRGQCRSNPVRPRRSLGCRPWMHPLRGGPAALAETDRRVLWHPFTQQQTWTEQAPLVIERADGTTLFDVEGRAYIDGVSSLWCNVHGHRHPAIDAAIREQLDRVAHSTMLGLSHPPAIELARRLVELAPPGLQRVFFSDSGSTAVEIALKMAYQWWAQREDRAGRPPRTTFIRLRDAYHGDTIGSVSVGGIDLFHACYGPLLFDSLAAEPGDAAHMQALLAEHGERVCAVVVEPLVQGAAGILVHPPGYLRAVRELCDRHGVPLVCDEVATGFGRTGAMFACEHENVAPDLMCVAKGLTGGYLPLAATLTTERIYEGFLGAPEQQRTFFHGHTYTGNPLACAAALATLDVFESERTLERLQPKLAQFGEALAELDRAAARPSPRSAAAASCAGSSCATTRRTCAWATASPRRRASAARSSDRSATSSC